MSDAEIWRIAVAKAAQEYDHLPSSVRARVEELCRQILACKHDLSDCFDQAGGPLVCARCRGECCRAGRYHFSAVDLLTVLGEGEEVVTPDFSNGACPFLGSEGCRLSSFFRPYPCATFLCEQIHEGMDGPQRQNFQLLSVKLLGLVRQFESLFANRFQGGLLVNGERYLNRRAAGILWVTEG